MRGRRWSAVVLVVGVALTTTAVSCGVPLEDSPRAIAESTTTQTTVTTTEPGSAGQTMIVYYFLADQLTAVAVPADDDPTAAEEVTAVLSAPKAPFLTNIPAGTELVDFTVVDRTATIDLSEDINTVEGAGQKAAYAQLVFTALASGEANRVTFEVAGEPVSAATDNGNRQIITASDYSDRFRPAG